MSVSWFRVMALVVAMACTAAATVSAQSVGTISGTVKDESGAAVPGAVVTARNEGTGAVREVVTDGEGRYVIAAVADRHVHRHHVDDRLSKCREEPT